MTTDDIGDYSEFHPLLCRVWYKDGSTPMHAVWLVAAHLGVALLWDKTDGHRLINTRELTLDGPP